MINPVLEHNIENACENLKGVQDNLRVVEIVTRSIEDKPTATENARLVAAIDSIDSAIKDLDYLINLASTRRSDGQLERT